MPPVFLYLFVMLAVICLWFLLLRRPVYEAVAVSFALLVCLTGKWGRLGSYLESAMSTSLLYSMTAFVAMSIIMTKTRVIEGAVGIILALCGRISGGAGYASVIASSFMGALSGSGPGNVMATGAITIPAMKRSGFPAELAANVESNASYLGNMIPPSSNIVAAFGAFMALYPQSGITTGQFWMILWGVSLWFILQKLLTVWAFCKYYKVRPVAKEELPRLREVIRTGWQGLLLPMIILLPFLLDYFLKDSLFTKQLGAQGAKYFSSSLLLFIPGVSALFAWLISGRRGVSSPGELAGLFAGSVKSIAPAVGVCLFGYMLGALFADLNVAQDLQELILAIPLGKLGMVAFICLVTCFLGMVIPGSSLVVIFGPVFITALASVGVQPLLAAAMLPCICGVMCGITPPLSLGLYAGMSIAGSDFGKTVKNDLWWVALHFLLEVAVLMGLLPIAGL